MQRSAWFVVPMAAALGCGVEAGSNAADEKKAEGKGVVVRMDGLQSRAPADWKEEAPSNRMRYAQFRLPRVKGDEHDAELVIFKGLGGSAEANIRRWKEQFQPPAGKTIDDIAKVEKIKVGDRPALYLDVRGTYLFKAQPFNPNAKAEQRPNSRMLAVHLDGKNDVYHIKLTGPANTVTHYKQGFDDWLKAFK